MTWLDAGILALWVLIGLGGYRQGFVRGVTRLAALLVIGLAGAILSFSAGFDDSITSVLISTSGLLCGVFLIVVVITWGTNRLVPPAFHAMTINKVLGVVPAVLQGIVVAALVIGLWHRVAQEQSTQRYLERGYITRRLIVPLTLLERALVQLP